MVADSCADASAGKPPTVARIGARKTAASSTAGNSPVATRGSVSPSPVARNFITIPSLSPAIPKPFPLAVRTEGTAPITLNRAGWLVSVPRRTTTCAVPFGVSSGTCTVMLPGVAA